MTDNYKINKVCIYTNKNNCYYSLNKVLNKSNQEIVKMYRGRNENIDKFFWKYRQLFWIYKQNMIIFVLY